MKYMCLIYENEAMLAAQSEAEREAVMGQYMAFTQRIREKGAMEDGAPLLPTNTATTVRVRDGDHITERFGVVGADEVNGAVGQPVRREGFLVCPGEGVARLAVLCRADQWTTATCAGSSAATIRASPARAPHASPSSSTRPD